MEKPNCNKCEYKKSIPGDAHIQCTHPDIDESPLGPIMALFGVRDNDSALHKLNIQANPHGVKNGWFMWPMNFDPVWLENCDGYKEAK